MRVWAAGHDVGMTRRYAGDVVFVCEPSRTEHGRVADGVLLPGRSESGRTEH